MDDTLPIALIRLMPPLSQQLILLTQYLLQMEDHLPGSLLAMAHLEKAQAQVHDAIEALTPPHATNGRG
jgi:hypothetical protein